MVVVDSLVRGVPRSPPYPFSFCVACHRVDVIGDGTTVDARGSCRWFDASRMTTSKRLGEGGAGRVLGGDGVWRWQMVLAREAPRTLRAADARVEVSTKCECMSM